MSYTFDPHHIFELVSQLIIFFVCSYFVFYICMLQTSNSINFDWYLHFHTYICDLIVLTISLHLKAQIMFMLNLIYSLMSIIFQLVSYTSLCMIFIGIS